MFEIESIGTTELKLKADWSSEETGYIISHVYMQTDIKGTTVEHQTGVTVTFVLPWDDLKELHEVIYSACLVIKCRRMRIK